MAWKWPETRFRTGLKKLKRPQENPRATGKKKQKTVFFSKSGNS